MLWTAATDVGRVRERNEDAYDAFVLPTPVGGHVFAVADGMGGARAGDVASALALRLFREHLLRWGAAARAALPAGVADALRAAVQHANHGIVRRASGRSDWYGMGTTLTAAWVRDTDYAFAHVGDSRLYLSGSAGLRQLSRDHGVVAELLRSGRISEEQARSHPHRHVLTQALGLEGDLRVDAGSGFLPENAFLLLCTDGLTNVLSEHDVLSELADREPSQWADRLIDAVNGRGGPDNVTVVVVRPRDAGAPRSAAQGGGSS